jgi:biotin transport system ATP-binding protein
MKGEVLFSIRNLSKEFPGESGQEPFRALSNINLDIFGGQCLLIAGSNGSGKTLLTRIIAALAEPSGGMALFRGRPLHGRNSAAAVKDLRRELGLVFQDADAQIVGETAAEDIAFGPENLGFSKAETEKRVDTALETMGLSAKREMPSRSLSGGEKRRLAVAGILAMGCSTLIMDEPFANLDWPGVVQTVRVIQSLKRDGKTLIILTHELEKALALADRLLILHNGVIQCDGTPLEVLNKLNPAWGVRDPRRNYAAIEDCSWLED